MSTAKVKRVANNIGEIDSEIVAAGAEGNVNGKLRSISKDSTGSGPSSVVLRGWVDTD